MKHGYIKLVGKVNVFLIIILAKFDISLPSLSINCVYKFSIMHKYF